MTEADLEIDRMLRNSLTAARPAYGWLSEETEDAADRLGPDRTFIVEHGDRIAQLVVSAVPRVALIEVDEIQETERGDGGFGSTGVQNDEAPA